MAGITCYDGIGCIGGNKILLEDGPTKIWLDFGMNYSHWGKFYEEYLQPKTCVGIYELVQMGLLPPIRGLYRNELVCSDVADPWHGKEPETIGDVSGILLSHAHLDHIGLLPYVSGEIPVYCSAMTFAIAKATQDTGTGASSQYCYLKSPKPTKESEKLITFSGSGETKRRPFVFAWGRSDEFSEFEMRGSGFKPGIGLALSCGGSKVRAFPVDHSIYGATAWAIETGSGCVVYAGDLRCHGRQAALTWEFAKSGREIKPQALIIEGTRIGAEDTCTENDVRDRALVRIEDAEGLVVADFGPRNIERLATFLEIARQTDRRLLLMPKDAYLIDQMVRAAGDGDVPSTEDVDIGIYDEYAGSSYSWKTRVREKYGEKFVGPSAVAQDQRSFICCFSFFDVNELAYIKPVPGSIWVYSSCEPFNEEMRIDSQRLREWLNLYGVRLLGDPTEDENNPFHVSGHACRSDLVKLIETIRPEVVIPVHTEEKNLPLYEEALKGICKVQFPERGVPIIF